MLEKAVLPGQRAALEYQGPFCPRGLWPHAPVLPPPLPPVDTSHLSPENTALVGFLSCYKAFTGSLLTTELS